MNRPKIDGVSLLPMLAAVWALVLTLGACTHDDGPEDSDGSTDPIIFAAIASQQIDTRADNDGSGDDGDKKGKYVDSGPIESGEFCLGYTNTSGTYKVADVNFDNSALAGSGLGLVWTEDKYKELSWNEVKNENPTTFYMDNVLKKYDRDWKEDHSKNEHASKIIFKSGHPFVAGLFDYVDGTNDLLWGSNQISRNTNPVKMTLHHYMAIVRVEVTVDKSMYEDEVIDFSTAEVSISNLVHKPYSFNRMDGSIELASNPLREELQMVDTHKNKNNGSELDWDKVETDVEEVTTNDDGEKVVKRLDRYTTKDFVLPPQGLPDGTDRPRLRLVTSNGRVFTGILPNAMWEVDDADKQTTPLSLYFLKEHKLTIRTRITKDPPELKFLPVTVRDWVCKDVHLVTGNQAGIYNADGFIKMMKAYRDDNLSAISGYGYMEGPTLVFCIYRSITLDYEGENGIFGQMTGGNNDFRFNINPRYKVYVRKDGVAYAVTAGELKTIVTGGEWNPTGGGDPGDTQP